MSLRSSSRVRPRPVAIRAAAVVVLLTIVVVWQRVVRIVTRAVVSGLSVDGIALSGLLVAVVFLAGLVLLALGWARYRDVDVGLRWPARAHWSLAVSAAFGAAALVAATVVIGTLTDVPYGALAKTHYGTLDPIAPVLVVAGLGVLVSVPGLALVCQALVQSSLRTVFDRARAIAATTVVASVALVSDTGGLAVAPPVGRLLGVALLALLVVLGSLTDARVENDRVRAIVVGALAVGALAVAGSALFTLDSVAGLAYALARVGVLALAALVYERSASLLPPMLVYLAFTLTNVLALLAGAGGPAPF